MNIDFRCRPAVLSVNFVCLRIVFSFVGGDYCTNTVPCLYHTLIVKMSWKEVFCFCSICYQYLVKASQNIWGSVCRIFLSPTFDISWRSASLSSSITPQKFVARKSAVGLRKLIFHICFETLGFAETVKLFEKRLESLCLKAPEEICDPYFKFSLTDSFYLLKISLNALSLVVFLIYGPGVTLFQTSVADPRKFIRERKIQLAFRLIALTKKIVCAGANMSFFWINEAFTGEIFRPWNHVRQCVHWLFE